MREETIFTRYVCNPHSKSIEIKRQRDRTEIHVVRHSSNGATSRIIDIGIMAVSPLAHSPAGEGAQVPIPTTGEKV
jgi:hypothetical protein